MQLSRYQDKSKPYIYSIVNTVTKVELESGREIIILMNNATMLTDQEERESLCIPFDMMRHGVMVDIIPIQYGGTQSISVEGERLQCKYDEEKCFYKITKPNKEEIETLPAYEITSPHFYNTSNTAHRTSKLVIPGSIPISEWRKFLALAPEDVIKKQFGATTQFYTNVEIEN